MNVYTQRAQQKNDNSPDCMYVYVFARNVCYIRMIFDWS